MSLWSARSLKWRLVSRLLFFETLIILSVLTIIIGSLWGSGYLIEDYEGGSLDVLKDALSRNTQGELILIDTPEVVQLRTDVGGLWFVIRDRNGQQLSQGRVPSEFVQTLPMLDHLSDARLNNELGRAKRPDAIVKWQETNVGDVQIFTGTRGRMTFIRMVTGISGGMLTIIIPFFLTIALATLAITPLVVRFALEGVKQAADQAAQITYNKRGVRLSASEVPEEISPFVNAVNDALTRLDKGYASHERFLAQAAHELRTPIAILNTRVAALSPSIEKTQLLQDTSRLAILSGQLLDLQRLNHSPVHFAPVDLVAIAGRVAFDLAPLAFAAGYEVSFESDKDELMVQGDQTSIERALTNLVQNAIDHGGGSGMILIHVLETKSIVVTDEGQGISAESSQDIFEPFSRLRSDSSGTGLGLNLVKQIMELHNGTIEVNSGYPKGACFKMNF
ncbi:HAMP domain-containing sensor histidine kinase [Phyllobacterium sp. OV277]|uniref:sensor histidine kinase n=1 Tax=Phyllobacterium sp. OV277 TaxID=1882772 RepID=UPI00088239B2|nr:HAMP domain-containing sensor histidine kinase [Phyllobacterium sp. OV277]SDP70115.1 Signal transduction histidine kinase [Phyllobacterium sp. OV277]